eukprot:SAG22_NODE_1129_length_5458_cov_33.388692_7_plen_91_part_00
MEEAPEPAPELLPPPQLSASLPTKIQTQQFTETVQGIPIHVLVVSFTQSCFIWVGGDAKAMPSLAAAASNKYVRARHVLSFVLFFCVGHL